MFADLVGFTALSRRTAPADLVGILNGIFTTFDLLVERSCLEKIKTIGDAYMLAGGIPLPRDDHAQAVADVALEMIAALDRLNAANGTELKMRIGLNTGPIVAGVIGKRKFTYDLWGDTVNLASRMESSGLPGAIQVSDSTHEALKNDFVLTERGQVEVKGIGPVQTYLLKARKDLVSEPRRGSGDGVAVTTPRQTAPTRCSLDEPCPLTPSTRSSSSATSGATQSTWPVGWSRAASPDASMIESIPQRHQEGGGQGAGDDIHDVVVAAIDGGQT